jgi:hypothetical protein
VSSQEGKDRMVFILLRLLLSHGMSDRDMKASWLDEPIVIRLPSGIMLCQVSRKFEVEVANYKWNQLGYLQHGDVSTDACPGAEAELGGAVWSALVYKCAS